jgi:hypothetical protein
VRVDSGTPVVAARYLEAPADLHFGVGSRFFAEDLYIASAKGRVDYLRPGP